MCETTDPFLVVPVDPGLAHSTEALGTKEKFWILDSERGKCLVKYPRPHSGEDWSEKIASHVADWLGLPHATYELAAVAGRRATISSSFVPDEGALVHGNELLMHLDSTYPPGPARYRVSAHTIPLVMAIVESPLVKLPAAWQPVDGIDTAADVFVGYLLLDALVSNTDRHHENWGLVGILTADGSEVRLAHTFDHASSLGCHETDDRKMRLIEQRDRRATVQTYCEKARSAFFRSETDRRPLGTLDAFVEAARRRPTAARAWIERLGAITDERLAKLVARVPEERISSISQAFAREMIAVNRIRLRTLST